MSEFLYQYTHDQWGPNITTKYSYSVLTTLGGGTSQVSHEWCL